MSNWTGAGAPATPIDGNTHIYYVSYSEMEKEVPNIAQYVPVDGNGDPVESTEAWVNRKILGACAVIDGRLRAVYTVPFAEPVDALIKQIALLYTSYYVMRPANVNEEIPANVEGYKKEANDLLKMLAEGEMTLEAASAESSAISSTAEESPEFALTKFDSEGNAVSVGTLDSGSKKPANSRNRW